MQTIDALTGGTRTWLVHTFGSGLEGEDRFVVERFKAMLDGDIRPVRPEAPKSNGRHAPRSSCVPDYAPGAAGKSGATWLRGFSTTIARRAGRRSRGRPADRPAAG